MMQFMRQRQCEQLDSCEPGHPLSRDLAQHTAPMALWQPAEAESLESARDAFPNAPAGEAFVAQGLKAVRSESCFAVLAIKIDAFYRPENRDQLPETFEAAWMAVARAIEQWCSGQKGVWGLLQQGIFGLILPAKSDGNCHKLALALRKRLSAECRDSISIGIALYPTLDFDRKETVANALKALDHAAFFGDGSVVSFDAVSLNISGDRCFDRGDVEGSIVEYKNALRLDPANINVLNSLGVSHGVLEKYDQALEAFNQAISQNASEVMAIFNCGLIKMLTGRHNQAMQFFIRASTIREDIFEIAYQTGKLCLQMEQPEQAIRHLENASRLRPDAGSVHRHLAEAHIMRADAQAASAAYEKAVKFNPEDGMSLSALGQLYLERNENIEIATLFCEQSVKLEPDNGLFWLRLAQLYERSGRTDEATKAFATAAGYGHKLPEADAQATEGS